MKGMRLWHTSCVASMLLCSRKYPFSTFAFSSHPNFLKSHSLVSLFLYQEQTAYYFHVIIRNVSKFKHMWDWYRWWRTHVWQWLWCLTWDNPCFFSFDIFLSSMEETWESLCKRLWRLLTVTYRMLHTDLPISAFSGQDPKNSCPLKRSLPPGQRLGAQPAEGQLWMCSRLWDLALTQQTHVGVSGRDSKSCQYSLKHTHTDTSVIDNLIYL